MTIYFIQAATETGPIKIGYTSRGVTERLNELQAHSPVRLAVLFTLEGDQDAEQQLHQRFALYRIHGEWFQASAEVMAFVLENTHKCAACGSALVVQYGPYRGAACQSCLDKIHAADKLRAKLILATEKLAEAAE